jgi:hypothetical protein
MHTCGEYLDQLCLTHRARDKVRRRVMVRDSRELVRFSRARQGRYAAEQQSHNQCFYSFHFFTSITWKRPEWNVDEYSFLSNRADSRNLTAQVSYVSLALYNASHLFGGNF